MNNNCYNPNGKIFEIDSACPLCWVFFGSAGAVISLALAFDDSPDHWLLMIVGLSISGLSFWNGWRNRNKNTKYIIDSKNNTFFVPLNDVTYCKLSDIDNVNKRQESTKTRQSYTENGKTKYRTVTTYTYYVQIIGQDISADFCFNSQGERNELYSSLKVGIKDIRNFLKTRS